MAKSIATDWYVSIDTVDFSNHSFDVQIGDSKEQIDVSGFSSTGNREFLPGQRDQTITIGMLNNYSQTAGSNVHAKLYALYTAGSMFPFELRPTSGTVSSTNPKFYGTASLYEFPVGATLNQRSEITVTMKPSNSNTWAWATA